MPPRGASPTSSSGSRGEDAPSTALRDYSSIVEAKDGKVRIVFRPADLIRSSRPAELRFRDPKSQAARFASIHAEMKQRENTYQTAVHVHMAMGKAFETFRMDWSADVAAMAAKLDQERDPQVRQMLALSILSTAHYGNDLDPKRARHALASLPAESPLWSLNPWALQKVVPIARGDSPVSDYAGRVTEARTDPAVTPILLAAAFMGERESGDQQAARHLYGRLLAEFPQARETRLAKSLGLAEKTAVGKKVPDFALPSLDDPSITFSPERLKGKATLIDFWATWCASCVGEMGNLHEAWKRYHTKGLEILSISFDESPDFVARFRREKWKLPWMNAWAGGGFKGEIARNLEVFALPKQILVDRDGTVVAGSDELRGPALQRTLDRIFEGPKGGK